MQYIHLSLSRPMCVCLSLSLFIYSPIYLPLSPLHPLPFRHHFDQFTPPSHAPFLQDSFLHSESLTLTKHRDAVSRLSCIFSITHFLSLPITSLTLPLSLTSTFSSLLYTHTHIQTDRRARTRTHTQSI